MKFWIQNTEIPKIFNLIFGAKIQIFLSLKFYQNWISWDKNWPFAPVCATALDSIKVHHNFLRLRATIKLNGRLHKCNKRPWLMLSMQSILIVIAFEISIFLSPSSFFLQKRNTGWPNNLWWTRFLLMVKKWFKEGLKMVQKRTKNGSKEAQKMVQNFLGHPVSCAQLFQSCCYCSSSFLLQFGYQMSE